MRSQKSVSYIALKYSLVLVPLSCRSCKLIVFCSTTYKLLSERDCSCSHDCTSSNTTPGYTRGTGVMLIQDLYSWPQSQQICTDVSYSPLGQQVLLLGVIEILHTSHSEEDLLLDLNVLPSCMQVSYACMEAHVLDTGSLHRDKCVQDLSLRKLHNIHKSVCTYKCQQHSSEMLPNAMVSRCSYEAIDKAQALIQGMCTKKKVISFRLFLYTRPTP